MELPIIIKLKHPLMHGDEKVTELKITREPVAGDLAETAEGQMLIGDTLRVLSRIANLPLSVVNQLKLTDLRRVNVVLGGFLDDGQ